MNKVAIGARTPAIKTWVNRIFDSMHATIKVGWSQGASARNDAGLAVPAWDPSARSFCLYGSMTKAREAFSADHVDHREHAVALAFVDASKMIDKIAFDRCGRGAVHEENAAVVYNDTPGRTQEEILSLIEDAKREYNKDH